MIDFLKCTENKSWSQIWWLVFIYNGHRHLLLPPCRVGAQVLRLGDKHKHLYPPSHFTGSCFLFFFSPQTSETGFLCVTEP